MTRKLVLKRYDPKSRQYFASERRYLLKRLDRRLIFDIIHFGSTAILGLKGKGFIDIYLIAKSKKQMPKLLDQIASNTDYIRPEIGGSKERIFHWRERKIRGRNLTFHLHASWRNAKEWKNDILFLRYLLKHPEAAKRYEELKYIWAEKANYVQRKYKGSKLKFINAILRKARKEKQSIFS